MNTVTRIRLAHERVRRDYSPLVNAALIAVGYVAHHVFAECARCLRRDWASFVAATAVGVVGAVVLVVWGA